MKINIHRYCNKVALSVGEQATQYLSQELAAQLSATLQEVVLDIAHREFTASQFESRELVDSVAGNPASRFTANKSEALKAKLRRHVTGAIERGEAVAIEAQELP